MTSLVIDNSMIESNPLVKKLVAEYFKVNEAETIQQQLINYQKLMDMKRKNAYNYFLKSKTDPDLKQKIDDNRRDWYEKHKDKVLEARRERLKNDTEFREKTMHKNAKTTVREQKMFLKKKGGENPTVNRYNP